MVIWNGIEHFGGYNNKNKISAGEEQYLTKEIMSENTFINNIQALSVAHGYFLFFRSFSAIPKSKKMIVCENPSRLAVSEIGTQFVTTNHAIKSAFFLIMMLSVNFSRMSWPCLCLCIKLPPCDWLIRNICIDKKLKGGQCVCMCVCACVYYTCPFIPPVKNKTLKKKYYWNKIR